MTALETRRRSLLLWLLQGSSPYWVIAFFLVIGGAVDLFLTPVFRITETCLFYFALFASNRFPYSFLFFLSLAFDSFSGFPLGLHGLLWSPVIAFIKSQNRFFYNKSFFMIWFFYGFCQGLFLAGRFFSSLFLFKKEINLDLGLISATLSILLFPLLASFFFTLYKRTQ